MLENTVFKLEQISNEISERYGYQVKNVEVINRGTANIYKIYTDKDILILKEFQSKYKEDDVSREVDVIEYLKLNSNVPVPEILKCKNNEKYFTYNGKVIVVQRFIEGLVCNKNENDLSTLIKSAECLGKIIMGLKEYNTDKKIDIFDWYSKEEFEKANKRYDEIIKYLPNTNLGSDIKEEIILKKNIMEKIKNTINVEELGEISNMVSHGDFSCLQCIFDENYNVRSVLDFIKVKKLPIIWEIFRSYSYADKEMINGKIHIDNLVKYVEEILKYVKLNAFDLKYLPYIYLIQLARSSYGYDEYINGGADKEKLLEFARYRTQICRNLYNQMDDILRELKKIRLE